LALISEGSSQRTQRLRVRIVAYTLNASKCSKFCLRANAFNLPMAKRLVRFLKNWK
jgi:hypothetical protein